MPYYRCAECDLTVYAGVGYSNSRVCPDCNADLRAAAPISVADQPQRQTRAASTRGTGAEAQAGAPSDGDRRALAVGRKWIEAVNRRDADALIDVTHAQATIHPTLLLPDNHGPYRGHGGVREWMAAVLAAEPLAVHISEVRPAGGSRVVGLGRVSINGHQASPLSIMLFIESGKVIDARGYLSDEDELRLIGHLPD